MGVAAFGIERFVERGEVFDAADAGDKAAAGLETLEGQFDDPLDGAAAAADEDAVGVGEVFPRFRARPSTASRLVTPNRWAFERIN